MHSLRYLIGFLFTILFSCQIIPAYSSVAVAPAPKNPVHGTMGHSLPAARKSSVEEKDQILSIVIGEVAKRVTPSDFDRGMDNFTNWIDDLIAITRRHRSSDISVEKSLDPTDEISEIISTSSHKDELIRTLNDLKTSLFQAKRDTFFLAQIAVFQSLSSEAQAEFRKGLRIEDRLDELSRFDKRKLDKIIINSDHLKILLIQRLTQAIGMGRDRASTLNDCKRVLNEFKSRLPQTMALRSYIESFLLTLDRKAREQSPVPVVLNKIIEFMSPDFQMRFKTAMEDDLTTMQNQWDEITKIEAGNVVPLWIDQEEREKQRLLDEAENKKKEIEAEKRHKQEEAEKKEKEEKAKQEADAKKSKVQQAKDKIKSQAKEKAKDAAGDATRNLLKGVLGDGVSSGGSKGSDAIDGLLGGFGF
ncbi:MAG: hypothetical protein K2W94_03955 [Alphaproteobacteria bacterium]|nr:hypothetical protein [Alphaproteobacteria bacterium]